MPKLNGREVENLVIENVDTKDYPDFCDAHIASAQYVDTGKDLTYKELEELEELVDMCQLAFESAYTWLERMNILILTDDEDFEKALAKRMIDELTKGKECK